MKFALSSDMEETQEAPPAVPPREVRTTEAAPVEISPTVAPHRTAPPIPERLILPKVVAAPLVEPVVEKVPESTIYPAVPQLSAEVLAPPAYSEALPDYAQAIKEVDSCTVVLTMSSNVSICTNCCFNPSSLDNVSIHMSYNWNSTTEISDKSFFGQPIFCTVG